MITEYFKTFIDNFSTSCTILVIILPVISAIISSYITLILTKKSRRIQDINKAYKHFRNAINIIRVDLDKINDRRYAAKNGYIKGVIDNCEDLMTREYLKLIPYLRGRRLRRFRKAFNNLLYTNKNKREDPRIAYKARNKKEELNARRLARKRIDRLLEAVAPI